MAQELLWCESILAQSGMDGNCTISKVNAYDSLYCEPPSKYVAPTLRVSFASPSGDLKTGAGVQAFTVAVRLVGDVFFMKPKVTISLRETGSSTDLATTGPINITETIQDQLVYLTWDASVLAAISGANVECYVAITKVEDTEFSDYASAKINSISWTADVVEDRTADIAVSAFKPEAAATALYTAPQPQFNATAAVQAPKPSAAATAQYDQAQFNADADVTAPKPGVFAAADYLPVTGTTGWFLPVGASMGNMSDSGVIVSNVSNMALADTSVASVTLQTTGGGTVQDSKSVAFNWSDPANYPAGAILDGIEVQVYVQYATTNFYTQQLRVYDLYVGNGVILEDSLAYPIPMDTDPGPLWDDVVIFGSDTDLFGVTPGTLVSDFLAQEFDGVTGRHSKIKFRNNGNLTGTDTNAVVKIGLLRMKLWWSVPNYIDMDSDVALSASVTDTTPLQRILDMGSAPAPSASISNAQISGNPINLYSGPVISVVASPDLSAATYIDNTSNVAIAVNLNNPTLVRIRNIFSTAGLLRVTATAGLGYANALSCDMQIAVTVNPQLSARRELQTDALGAWFTLALDGNLEGDMSLKANVPVTVTVDGNSMEVNWALYADATVSVLPSAVLSSFTDLYSNPALSVEIDADLIATVDIDADVGLSVTVGAELITLGVITPEERRLRLPAKNRNMRLSEKDRRITLTSN